MAAFRPHYLRHSHINDWLLWLLRRQRRFRVVGESMLPLLPPETEVLIRPGIYRRQFPCAGDLVVAEHPQRPGFHLLKWVVFVEADGSCYVQGLNLSQSTDSRQFGLVPRDGLIGRVVCRFP
ncbi:nickel-type superoxide dismutase maturation protease [filamentous cyanobacterium CCP5]|nr:nickel-type superoxide dismutase maturation protease [filamentous cyanobacterium CCP5]